MIFTNLFKSKAKNNKPRRVLDVATMRVIVNHAIGGNTAPNYRSIWTKQKAACPDGKIIEDASAKSYSPWSEHVWECEDQVRSLIDSAQRVGANEGMTFAIGGLIADPPGGGSDGQRHFYVFMISDDARVSFFDATAREWTECPQNIYFSSL